MSDPNVAPGPHEDEAVNADRGAADPSLRSLRTEHTADPNVEPAPATDAENQAADDADAP